MTWEQWAVLAALVVGWVVVNRWVLPRLGLGG